MVVGLESFREHFREYADCYTVIGGTACDILMSDADMDFRMTKDIDMILILENRPGDFARTFWEYIKEGGYRCGWRTSESVHFYRFTDPRSGYPAMIELFSRMPDEGLPMVEGIIPVHIDDDVSSLSAILLNDDFYAFMMEGRRTVSDVSVLSAEYLIPFKMYAWLDLRARHAAGQHVNERDLRKHKYDVFRLLQIVRTDETIATQGTVRQSVIEFLDRIVDEPMSLDRIGVPFTLEEGLEVLRQLYDV